MARHAGRIICQDYAKIASHRRYIQTMIDSNRSRGIADLRRSAIDQRVAGNMAYACRCAAIIDGICRVRLRNIAS